MEIATLTQQPTASGATTTTRENDDTVISSDFETFLNMLTAQLENQDPLDPVKSEDFAVQLATFSSVEQQVLTNDLLEQMTLQMGLSNMGQYASWVGMEVRAAVPAKYDGSPITLAPKPDLSADRAVLVVSDADGNEIQRQQISVSHDPLQWSGILNDGTRVLDGSYAFTVESYTDDIVPDVSPVEVYSKITEARSDNGETVLITEAGGEVKATEVTALRNGG